MLTEKQVAQFHSDGFLNGGPVVGDDEIEVLLAEVDRIMLHADELERRPVLIRNISGRNEASFWQIVNIWEASDAFRELMSHRKIAEEIAQLTAARELRIWHDQILYKPAETGSVHAWHQDAPLWPIIKPMTEVSAWLALDDVAEDNGCMSMVPGSHLWGDRIEYLGTVPAFDALPAQFEGHRVAPRFCPVRRGEVHYHHALTWHGSHANASGRPRRAIAFHYMTGESRYDAAGEHLMKPFVTVADGELLQGEHFPQVYP